MIYSLICFVLKRWSIQPCCAAIVLLWLQCQKYCSLEKISLYFHESAFVNESGFKSGIKCTCLDFSLDMHYKKVVSTNELLLSLVFLTFDKWYNYLFDRGVHRQPL
jgi:hypothetical protein